MPKHLILCDCLGSQAIDAKAISDHCDVTCSRIHTELCGREIAQAAQEITRDGAIVACLQEQTLFEELTEETGAPMPDFLDLRDRSGWSDDTNTSPKMIALINDALLPQAPVKMLDIQSDGRCLILGADDIALKAADDLSEQLAITVLMPNPPEFHVTRQYEVVVGDMKQVSGSLGDFNITINQLRQMNVAGRGAFEFGEPRDGGHTTCDIILDLSGGSALFSGHARDGYLRADPRDGRAVAGATLAAAQLVGGFEKPLYVRNNTRLCAQSRAEISGCSACIDNCSSGAIRPDGEHVTIDPNICAGCGDCVALCPSGALEFEAPETSHLFKRIQTLASSFSTAGGSNPSLLVCGSDHGAEMISLAARFGAGLPGHVIPLELESTALFGHSEMLAALACGFTRVDFLLPTKSDATTQASEAALANAIAGDEMVHLLCPEDPEALSATLYDAPTTNTASSAAILPQGTRRQVARLAAKALVTDTTSPIPLPENAPYGRVNIDTQACTLCLSCVTLCPSGALSENPDSPQLRFVADACLQCGLCTRACPENALTLAPQLDLSDAALSSEILHEEEPFACISCGALFGVKSTVEKITNMLAGKHEMFATSEAGKLIQMCDKCRIDAQYHSESQPFQGADRPPVITTEDYFSKRKDH